MDTQVSGGGAAHDHRRAAIGRPGENPVCLAHVFLAGHQGGDQVVGLLGHGAAIAPPTDGLASMNRITPDRVREFLLTKYKTPIRELGLDPAMVGDDFDFLLRGVIDSFGILTMITSIEDEFHILLDMERLDAEQITILGPLSRYVAEQSSGGDQSACA